MAAPGLLEWELDRIVINGIPGIFWSQNFYIFAYRILRVRKTFVSLMVGYFFDPVILEAVVAL